MTQPDALRLADLLQDECGVDGYVLDESAAELRRQHAECNDLARQLNESNERNGRLKAQRDALLEACERCFSLLSATRHAVYSQSRVAP